MLSEVGVLIFNSGGFGSGEGGLTLYVGGYIEMVPAVII